MAEADWAIRVFYLWDFGVVDRRDPGFGRQLRWDVDLLSGYQHEFVPNHSRDPGTHHFLGLNNPSLHTRLTDWNPDAVVVFGYKFLTHLRLIAKRQWPLIFRGDSHLIDHPGPGGLKRWMLSWVYRRFTAVTFVGRANRDYFRAFGVPEHKLFFAPHCVDATRFAVSEALRAQARALKAELGVANHRIVLYAGKLVPSKQPCELLQAFVRTASTDTALVFVGAGEERPRLEALAAMRPDVPVRFLPFANQSEMPVRYSMADVFALPSSGLAETWGLAVNEAMHMGVPCLVSNRVGCQQDLVTDGETGWVFKADSQQDLAATLSRALVDVRTRPDQMRTAVQARISKYTYAAAAAGLESAVAAALANRHTK